MSDIGELHRQYQADLEADRTLRSEFADTVSAADILQESADAVALSHEAMRTAWKEWARHRLSA